MLRVEYDSYAFTMQKYGGISRYFISLIEQLNGYRDISTKINAGYYQNCYLKNSDTPRCGKYVDVFNSVTLRSFTFLNQALSNIQVRRTRPDILHQTYYSMYRPKSLPVIVTVHDMIHELYYQMFPWYDKTSAKKSISIKNADGIICISNQTKQDLMNIYQVDEKKIKVIHHGINKFQNKCSHTASFDFPFLLYVGSRWGYKNFDNFLKAYSLSKFRNDISLVTFGGGNFTPRELALIRSYGLSTKQVYNLSGDDDLLFDLYTNAVAFVYPSIYEGFGLPPLEAMSLGCPVISSNTSCMPEILEDSAAYFDPLSTESIVCTLDKLLQSETNLIIYRKLGHLQAQKYSWERCAYETKNFYKLFI